MCRASVSNEGDVARLLVRWPRFQMLATLVLRTRDAVLDDIAAGIWDAEFGAALDDLTIEVGYSPTGGTFIPSARVTFRDRDSGAGFLIPLVDLPPDADLDGVPDASDNCPDFPNPAHQVPVDCNADGDTDDFGEATGEQCDRDGDTVGDECDNCPDTPNRFQEDVDDDGTGDACEVPQGKCELPDGSCEEVSRDDCTEAGGTYTGDGTACAGSDNVPTVTEWGTFALAMLLLTIAALGIARRRPTTD